MHSELRYPNVPFCLPVLKLWRKRLLLPFVFLLDSRLEYGHPRTHAFGTNSRSSICIRQRFLLLIHPKDYNALRKGFSSGKFKSIAYRKYQLLQLAYLLHDNTKRFEEAFTVDLGRPPYESYSYVCPAVFNARLTRD